MRDYARVELSCRHVWIGLGSQPVASTVHGEHHKLEDWMAGESFRCVVTQVPPDRHAVVSSCYGPCQIGRAAMCLSEMYTESIKYSLTHLAFIYSSLMGSEVLCRVSRI